MAGVLCFSVHLRVVTLALARAEGGLRRPALWCQGPGEFGDGMVQGSGAGVPQRSLGLGSAFGCRGALVIVERGLGLFSAMAHLSTLYKGAGVPLFFYNGVG